MKTLFLIGLFSPLFGFSQVHMELGTGASYSTYQGINDAGKSQTTKAILPVLKFAIGYETANIVLEGSVQPSLSRLVNSPKLFGAKIGYDIDGFIPFIGYYSDHANSDNTGFNSSFIGYGLKYQSLLNENAGLYFEGLKAGNNYQITGGIHYKF